MSSVGYWIKVFDRTELKLTFQREWLMKQVAESNIGGYRYLQEQAAFLLEHVNGRLIKLRALRRQMFKIMRIRLV